MGVDVGVAVGVEVGVQVGVAVGVGVGDGVGVSVGVGVMVGVAVGVAASPHTAGIGVSQASAISAVKIQVALLNMLSSPAAVRLPNKNGRHYSAVRKLIKL